MSEAGKQYIYIYIFMGKISIIRWTDIAKQGFLTICKVFHLSIINAPLFLCASMQGIDDKVLVEIFLEGGREFTAIVLDVGSEFNSHPVTLLPTEVIELLVSIFS